MRPGDTVKVVRGKHQGSKALIKASESYFYHVDLLTDSGHKVPEGQVSLHKSALAPMEGSDGR